MVSKLKYFEIYFETYPLDETFQKVSANPKLIHDFY